MMEECKIGNKPLLKLLILSAAVFLGVLSVAKLIDIQGKLTETQNTITVSGTGTIYAKPDLALVSLSVITEAKTVAKAMADNTEKMNAIIGFVKEKGVEDKDLKTTNFNIYPRYEYENKDCSLYYCPPGKRVLTGYTINQSLEVKMRDMEKIGEIIEGATTAGANEVGNLQFTIDNQDELKKQAREDAIEKAKAKAKELAKLLGVRLVRINSFSESSVLPYYFNAKEAMGLGGAAPAAPQIETGENKIEVTVSITYEIR